MKSFTLAALALANAAQAQNLFASIMSDVDSFIHEVSDATKPIAEDLYKNISDKVTEHVAPLTTKVSKNKFGALVEESVFPFPYVEKTITAPLVPFNMDYAQQEAFLNNASKRHQEKTLLGASQATATCDDRSPTEGPSDWGMFLPVFAADVSAANPKATYKGRCFDEITFEFEKTSETTFDVHVTTEKPRSHLCKDVIMFANTEIQHFEVFFFKGNHKLTFQMNTPESQADVGYGGIKAFAFCENVV